MGRKREGEGTPRAGPSGPSPAAEVKASHMVGTKLCPPPFGPRAPRLHLGCMHLPPPPTPTRFPPPIPSQGTATATSSPQFHGPRHGPQPRPHFPRNTAHGCRPWGHVTPWGGRRHSKQPRNEHQTRLLPGHQPRPLLPSVNRPSSRSPRESLMSTMSAFQNSERQPCLQSRFPFSSMLSTPRYP